MGGNSTTNSTKTNTLGNTTTSNPYAISNTTNSGTTTNFQDGTALKTIYDTVNNNIGNLIQEYLNPSLNSTTNQSKLNSFKNELNNQMYQNLENNIINPLTNRNMIRSSQATDLYKNASNAAASQIASYANDLLSESQDNTAEIISNLLSAYMKGYNVIKDSQNVSLDTSKSNATENTNTVTQSNGAYWTDIATALAKEFIKSSKGSSDV